MQSKIKIFFAAVIVLLVGYLSIPASSTAKLDSIIRKAIMVAYMNGYVDALTLKIKDIKKLKANERLLKQKVEKKAANYIFTVEKMNQE